MTLSPIDPKRLTRSETLPWLSSRLQFSSRTLWMVVFIVLAIALLFSSVTDDTVVYTITGLVVFIFLFAVNLLLRSTAPVTLLLLAFFGEFAVLRAMFSTEGPEVSAAVPTRLFEEISVVAMVAVVLGIAAGMARLSQGRVRQTSGPSPGSAFGADRATTLVMVAVAAAAAAATFDTLARHVYPQVIDAEGAHVYAMLNSAPVKQADFPLTFTFVTVNPMTGEDRQVEQTVNWDDWKNKLMSEIAAGSGHLKGAMAVVPRGLTLLLGFGAYAAFVGFIAAFTRGRDLKVRAVQLAVSLGVLIVLHQIWTSVADNVEGPLALALLAFIGAVVLVAGCLYAVDHDRQSGFADVETFLGTSFVPPSPP
jgi:hypothetical protein